MERRFFATVDSSRLTGAVVLVGELGAVEPGVEDGEAPVPGVFFLMDRRRLTGSAAAGAAGSSAGFASGLTSLDEREEVRLGLGGRKALIGGSRTAWEEEEVEMTVLVVLVLEEVGSDVEGKFDLGFWLWSSDLRG